jgi:hypothetical protein
MNWRKLAALRRAPLVHFLLLGALLALARLAFFGTAPDEAHTIAITEEVIARLVANNRVATGRGIDPVALDRWVDDEVLYREGLQRGLAWNPAAIARLVQLGRFVGGAESDPRAGEAMAIANAQRLGLGRDDPLVRAQVVGKMRLLLREQAMRREPTADELEAYLAAHAERFARPARTSFAHLFVRRDRGSAGLAMLEALATRIRREDVDLEQALALGDAFPLGQRFESLSRQEVEAILGAELARTAMTQPEQQWSSPVKSPYGWHVVWVEDRTAGWLPPLAAMRDKVRYAWRAEQAGIEVASRVRELRKNYRVEIAPALKLRLASTLSIGP